VFRHARHPVRPDDRLRRHPVFRGGRAKLDSRGILDHVLEPVIGRPRRRLHDNILICRPIKVRRIAPEIYRLSLSFASELSRVFSLFQSQSTPRQKLDDKSLWGCNSYFPTIARMLEVGQRGNWLPNRSVSLQFMPRCVAC
jgi:hypothetical protein